MTSYNPKDWISFIFQLSKGDTFQNINANDACYWNLFWELSAI